jgi:hypothetical protein
MHYRALAWMFTLAPSIKAKPDGAESSEMGAMQKTGFSQPGPSNHGLITG